jgi:uncharacterized protein (UPF0333 family)
MRGQVTLEALLVMLALVTAIGLWVSVGSNAMNNIKNELGNATIRQAETKLNDICNSVRAMGNGNSISVRVFVANNTIIRGVFLEEGWNNVTAEWNNHCLLASTTSSQ